jgi:hypothetical protein
MVCGSGRNHATHSAKTAYMNGKCYGYETAQRVEFQIVLWCHVCSCGVGSSMNGDAMSEVAMKSTPTTNIVH